jgi:methylase of polypeptide subunit release factors
MRTRLKPWPVGALARRLRARRMDIKHTRHMTTSPASPVTTHPVLSWDGPDGPQAVRWRSENGTVPPKRVVAVDDTTPADTAYRLASEGTALVWQGDFQNARHLLIALTRRVDRTPVKAKARARAKARKKAGAAAAPAPAAAMPTPAEAFHRHRMVQAQRAHTLGMLVIPFDPGHVIPLRRAPDVAAACEAAYGPADEPYVASLRELLGLIGAHEWRRNGVEIPAMGERIHPHYGVFAPIRSEYVELVSEAPLPEAGVPLAFDIGTGTGVLAAVLARRGVERIVATDQDPRALACARENLARLGLERRVQVVETDLFPAGRAPLVVCNPPWVPARPSSTLEQAIYDPDSRMLRGFLAGLSSHLAPDGEGWLVLSDLAEHLGLRSRADLEAMIQAGGLRVVDRIDTRPAHPKAGDPRDPLHAARSAEHVSLWRLKVR